MEILVWTLTILLCLVGLAGIIIPVLPGTTLILAAILLHKFLLGGLGWVAMGWITGFWVLSIVVDIAGVLVGTRLAGGTRWGLAGATGGGLVGMFFSLPALIVGTIFGAIAAERFLARRTGREALWAGAGAAAGFLLSTFGRFVCAAVMIALFLIAVLQG